MKKRQIVDIFVIIFLAFSIAALHIFELIEEPYQYIIIPFLAIYFLGQFVAKKFPK